MTPQDHWNQILISNPRYRSESARGWDFRPIEADRVPWLRLVLFVGAALIAGGFYLMFGGVL